MNSLELSRLAHGDPTMAAWVTAVDRSGLSLPPVAVRGTVAGTVLATCYVSRDGRGGSLAIVDAGSFVALAVLGNPPLIPHVGDTVSFRAEPVRVASDISGANAGRWGLVYRAGMLPPTDSRPVALFLRVRSVRVRLASDASDTTKPSALVAGLAG